ncbi:MAG: Fur family transcriptional regulator [Nocardioidaceae bacterium]|nr:Fur family transcriptional regulator [Nocardioidaceae bacterium]
MDHQHDTRVDHPALLRSSGLRATTQRLRVLDFLGATPHATARDVLVGVRAAGASMSTQAVYDVLHALVGAGLARTIEPPGSSARYEVRVGDNHHHLICRGCGDVTDVDCARGTSPCLTPATDHGFVVDEAEIVYWGTCAACARPTIPNEELS